MKFLLALAIVAVSVPVVSHAADQPGQKKERRICKRVVNSRSHIEERPCLTPTQWAARRVDKGDDLDKLMVIHRERARSLDPVQ
jgi:hypothetical protein